MASNAAAIKLTVAQRQALAALNQFQAKFAAMTNSMSANTKKAANAGSRTNKILSSWGGSIKTAALAMVGFGSATGAAYTVISLVRKELGVINDTMDRMKDRQLDYGQTVAKVAWALPAKGTNALADMDIDEISDRFSKGTNDPGKALRVFQHIHGANADLALSKKAEITETLMTKRYDLDEEEMKVAGVQVADNHAKNLARGLNSSVESMVALFEGAKAASKVTDDAAFYGNVAPIGLDMARFGYNQGESLLLASALTSAANDREGTESRTALTKFAAQLEEVKAQFGVEESGIELLRALREGKSQKHKDMQKHLLGVFADGEEDGFLEMTKAQAALKLEGRSKQKFYLMDLIRERGEEDPNNLRNVMKVIKESGQIPIETKGDTFEVDMEKTLQKSREQFASKIDDISSNKHAKIFIKKNKLDTTASDIEMSRTTGADQKMKRDAFTRIMQNSGVPMSELWSDIEYYTNQYGKDEGMQRVIKKARRRLILDHPNQGVDGVVTMSNGQRSFMWEKMVWDEEEGRYKQRKLEELSVDELGGLFYQRRGLFKDYDTRRISDEQLESIKSLDRLSAAIENGGFQKIEGKVEITNAGALNESTGAAGLGE